MLIATGEVDTESLLKRLIEQHPEAWVLHLVLGNFYASRSRWGEARREYSTASDQESGDARIIFNLAVSLDHLGRTEAAARYYLQAIQLDSSGAAGFDHAQAQLRLQELSAAKEATWIR